MSLLVASLSASALMADPVTAGETIRSPLEVTFDCRLAKPQIDASSHVTALARFDAGTVRDRKVVMQVDSSDQELPSAPSQHAELAYGNQVTAFAKLSDGRMISYTTYIMVDQARNELTSAVGDMTVWSVNGDQRSGIVAGGVCNITVKELSE